MKKRIFAALMALLLVGSLTVAAHEVPDLTRNGTITFSMDWNGEPLEGGSLTMYRVGDIAEDDGNYNFACVPGIEAVSLEDLNDPALAETLAEAAQNADLETITVPIADGKAVFADVVPGLYVVTQEEAAGGFAPLSPFLISMPQFADGHYEYDIAADPKVPLEAEPTEPTQPTEPGPTDPWLPQTGQLNWPVPMLAVAGLALFIAGWILRFGSKKENYEK